jgi:hypothetical protein
MGTAEEKHTDRTWPPEHGPTGTARGPEDPPRGSVLAHRVVQDRALMVLLAVGIIVAGMYILVPNWTEVVTKKIDNMVGNPEKKMLTSPQTQAEFVNLDGRVHVKRWTRTTTPRSTRVI